MKQVCIAIIAGCLVVLALLLGYWFNLPGVHQLVGAANDALTQVFGALVAGVKILFFTGLVLGVAYAVIELRRRNNVTVITGTKYHPAQAVIHRGQLVQLTQPGQQQLDPAQHLALLKQVLAMQGQMQRLAQQTYVEAVPQPQIAPATVASLPAPASVQTFRELLNADIVQEALKQGKMLLGYVAGQLRYGSWFDLYSCGIGGVSGSGKTTTVRFLLFQAILSMGKFVMIDPHIGEPEESLAAQFRMFQDIHAMPPCDDTPAYVARRIRFLFKEYAHRKAKGIKGPPLVFVLDEFNAIVRRLPDELRKELADLLLTIAQEGRKFGIFAMIIGQRWSENDLGGKNYGAAIRSSLASTLAHRFTDEDQAKKLIGSKNGAKCLDLEQGHYYFRDTSGKLSETVTPYTTMEDGVIIQELIIQLLEDESMIENTEERDENTPESVISGHALEPLNIRAFQRENTVENTTENTEIQILAQKVTLLQAEGVQKPDIMRQVWNVNPGGSPEYKQAVQQYQEVMKYIAGKLGA